MMSFLTLLPHDSCREEVQLEKAKLYTWKSRFWLGPLNDAAFNLLHDAYTKYRVDNDKEKSYEETYFEKRCANPSSFNEEKLSLNQGSFFLESKRMGDFHIVDYLQLMDAMVVHENTLPKLWSRLEVLGAVTVLLHAQKAYGDPMSSEWLHTLDSWLDFNRTVEGFELYRSAGCYESTIYNDIFEPSSSAHPLHNFYTEWKSQ